MHTGLLAHELLGILLFIYLTIVVLWLQMCATIIYFVWVLGDLDSSLHTCAMSALLSTSLSRLTLAFS